MWVLTWAKWTPCIIREIRNILGTKNLFTISYPPPLPLTQIYEFISFFKFCVIFFVINFFWYSPVKTVASYNDVVVVIVAITWRKSPTYRVTGRGRATPRCTPPAAELSPAKYRHLAPGTWQNMDSYLETAKSEAITACNPSWPEIHRRSCGGRLLCHHHYNLCPRPFYHNNNNDNNINNMKKEKT